MGVVVYICGIVYGRSRPFRRISGHRLELSELGKCGVDRAGAGVVEAVVVAVGDGGRGDAAQADVRVWKWLWTALMGVDG